MTQYPAWLEEPTLQQFFAATREAGGEARAVGGAVRDFLLGLEGSDVDIASTLTPEQTMELATKHGWKAVPTGIAHGTVTLVFPGRIAEVTTLRRDVETDGRHATVAYTENWQEDAARRDFTMNALYMDGAGHITDYFSGQDDINTQTLRFIGNAEQRIEEDGLRILRFFRFLASHGKPPADAAALAAITAKKDMIANLSGERIANEMRKLLRSTAPAYALRLMNETGVAALVFGRTIDPSRMIRLQLLEGQAGYQTSVWARVIALTHTQACHPGLVPGSGGATGSTPSIDSSLSNGRIPAQGRDDKTGAEVTDWITQRWKIARHETKQLHQLVNFSAFNAAAPRHTHTRILRLYTAPAYLDWLLLQAAITPGINIAPYVTLAQDFKAPVFPLTAKDLLARGMREGKALGEALSQLEQQWEESDYTLNKDKLMDYLPN